MFDAFLKHALATCELFFQVPCSRPCPGLPWMSGDLSRLAVDDNGHDFFRCSLAQAGFVRITKKSGNCHSKREARRIPRVLAVAMAAWGFFTR